MNRQLTFLTGLLMATIGGASFADVPGRAHDAPGAAPQRYSYFSPARGTVNLDNQEFDPSVLEARGRALDGDVIVLTGVSHTLARLSPNGRVRWMLDVADGGGAYGLTSFDGLLVVTFGSDILLVDPEEGQVVSRLPVLAPGPTQFLSFVRVQAGLLIAGESRAYGDIVIGRLEPVPGQPPQLKILERIPTRMEAPRDALMVTPEQLLVADTFGHAVVLFERRERWRETRRWAEYYPNMLDWHNGELTVLSEHANRIGRWNLQSNQRQVLVACPDPLFSDARTRPQQLVAEEPRTRSGESPPRQICSADIAGDQTLYAANGFFDEGNGRLWVADADNHRVALFVDGQFWGAITGINHPVRVIPVGSLH